MICHILYEQSFKLLASSEDVDGTAAAAGAKHVSL
jgi:hypothetical protein